jgi:spore coat protein U-like protein
MVNCCFGFQAGVTTGPGGLPLNYGLFSQTGNNITITNTRTESTLIDTGVGTLSVPANGFKVGDTFHGQFMGILNSLNNATLNFRVKTGSVVLATSNAQTLPSITNGIWLLTLDFTIRAIGGPGVASIVSFGTFYDIKQSNNQQQGFSFTTTNSTTFDTTIANTLNVTAQWGASSTSNSIHPDIFVLNKIF